MKVYNWTSKFEFGKYNNITVEDVFNLDAYYLIWFHMNICEICFNDEIVLKIVDFSVSSNDQLTALFRDDFLMAEVIKIERKLEYLKKQVEKRNYIIKNKGN